MIIVNGIKSAFFFLLLSLLNWWDIWLIVYAQSKENLKCKDC